MADSGIDAPIDQQTCSHKAAAAYTLAAMDNNISAVLEFDVEPLRML